MDFHLTHTHIKVEGTNDDIVFSDLVIIQKLADVNSFTFTWRQPEGKSTLSSHVSFYKKNLSKVVTININDNLTFKGIICAINCNNQDSLGVSYEIIGKGLLAKVDEVQECNSFYKKNLSNIFSAINNVPGTSSKISPNNKKELFYTVQYNQTGFEFMKMMAARNGEWLYYNGTELVLGNPDSNTVSLTHNEDVHDVDIMGKLVKISHKNSAFDSYKGEMINGGQKAVARGGGILAAAVDASDTTFGNNKTTAHISYAVNSELLKDISTLQQQSAAAAAVSITARSYNSKLKLAGKIKLRDEMGGNAGEYIITEIHHNCVTDNSYQNNFVAIPAETEVPPYTNPNLFAVCKPQPALVVNNEDKDGLDRIKVRFPWQQTSESTPWISVVTPHAGKDKGIRFLPEVNEEVLVSFLDNNAERPFVLGAVHTNKNKSGNDPKNNNLKIIGTQSGRRLEVDDNSGTMRIIDNFSGKVPMNVIRFQRDKDTTQLMFISIKDNTNSSLMQLNNSDSVKIGLQENNTIIAEILLEKSGKKITIHSKGSIELNADQSISLNAANINISASQELNMEGKKSASLKGLKVEIEADTDLKAKGLQTSIEGTAQAEVKSSGIVSVTGSLVKIN